MDAIRALAGAHLQETMRREADRLCGRIRTLSELSDRLPRCAAVFVRLVSRLGLYAKSCPKPRPRSQAAVADRPAHCGRSGRPQTRATGSVEGNLTHALKSWPSDTHDTSLPHGSARSPARSESSWWSTTRSWSAPC